MTNEEKVLIVQDAREVNQIMSTYVGIVRSDLRLHRAWERLDLLYEETEHLFKRVKPTKDICELRNMINVGYLITRQAANDFLPLAPTFSFLGIGVCLRQDSILHIIYPPSGYSTGPKQFNGQTRNSIFPTICSWATQPTAVLRESTDVER